MQKSSLLALVATPLLAISTAMAGEGKVDLNGVSSGTYGLDKGHGYIMMTYEHQGYSSPYLRFVGFDADLTLDANNPLKSSVSVNIDPATVDSGVEKFDQHLVSADFFDVENHKEISFVSTKLELTGDNVGVMTGDLTIKGITKPVTLDVKLNKADFAQRANTNKIGFSAKGQVKRSDFDLGLYVPYVGDAVDIIIETEFEQQK